MKRLLKDAVIFVLAFVIIFHLLEAATFDPATTSSTWKYIQGEDPEPIDILFMGNSHAFCDINPTIINQSMGLNTMILGSNSQPMDQTYENLKILLHYVRPKVIVLESNALVVTTDSLYAGGNEGRLFSNFDSIRSLIYRAGDVVHTVRQYYKWPEACYQLMRPTNTWTRFRDHTVDPDDTEAMVNFVLGHHPRNNIIRDSNDEPAYVEQKLKEYRNDPEPLAPSASTRALYRFLDLIEKEGIPLYIIKTPVLCYDNDLPKLANLMDELAGSHPAIKGYRNFSEEMTRIGMKHDDFSDVGHLNREGACRFTLALADWLSSELQIPCDSQKVTAVQGESYEQLPDGNFRYTVDLTDNTLIKFIVKDKNDTVVSETDYSDQNSIVIPRISTRNKLYYRIRPRTAVPGCDYPFSSLEYNYMHDRGVLGDYSSEDFYIKQSGNVFRFTNNYDRNEVEYSWYVKKDKETIKNVKYAYGRASLRHEFTEPGEYTVYAYIRLKEDHDEFSSVLVATVTIDEEGNASYTVP